MKDFRALMLKKINNGTHLEIQSQSAGDLPIGEVTIKVAYSSVNYKDAVVGIQNIFVKSYPLIPGIDLAGTVIEARDGRFREGDQVIVTGYGLGMSHHGGFAEVARVPAEWVVPLPEGLTLREAMILGTAGFTAALSIQRLEDHGLEQGKGPVLVTGATGGVGSVAVAILAKKGYEVTATTGKWAEQDYLKRLGAKHVMHREEAAEADGKGMGEERWAGAVDPVGGRTLQYILSSLRYGGSVASSGFTGGMDVSTTVLPFILKGVNWLGIDSVWCPMNLREKTWKGLGTHMKPSLLNEEIVNEISLDQVPEQLSRILKGDLRGRTIVSM